jgi:hypothetical protein
MDRRIMNFLRSDAIRARAKSLLGKPGVWLLVVTLLLGMPGPPAHAQVGIDLGVIEAGLQAILTALKTAVGAPLQAIEAIEQSWTRFEQTVVYPQQSILQAQNAVAGFALPMQQMNQIVSMSYTSAQLPAPQQLEQQLLSGDPNQVANLGAAYHQVYGDLPAATQAPQHVQNSIDITDAEAQDGFKKAIELDALALEEEQVAQQLNQQIQQAAPGSAPILEADAAAWVVRANAYTQSAMAELMRVRSASIANQGATMKDVTRSNVRTNQNLQQMLNTQ